MKEIKRRILRIFFVLEICVFIGVYAFGPHGIQHLRQLSHENEQLEREVQALKIEVSELEQKIVQWNTHSFYKEKIAREQLQMAYKNEEIYYL